MPGILNISEASAIGVHAMMLIAGRPGRSSTVPDLAAELKVSAAHLQKVLQRLVHAGLAASTRGPKGGYALARSAESIRLGEVFQAIEGARSLGACLLDKDRCCMGTCALGDMLHSVSKAMAEQMRARLSDLVRAPAETDGRSRKPGPRFAKRRALI
ncbi:MAG: Rrf2 family transcriptional regulator [Elusimicrobia bacterium]|nr:Rrf2 family transcriptional regulator [Elusimicrobiota bacterium]